ARLDGCGLGHGFTGSLVRVRGRTWGAAVRTDRGRSWEGRLWGQLWGRRSWGRGRDRGGAGRHEGAGASVGSPAVAGDQGGPGHRIRVGTRKRRAGGGSKEFACHGRKQ